MPFWKFFQKRTTPSEAPQRAPRYPGSKTIQSTAAKSKSTTAVPTNKANETPAEESVDQTADTAELELLDLAPKRSVPGKGGFDPYNSGSFDRRGNWDKTKLK